MRVYFRLSVVREPQAGEAPETVISAQTPALDARCLDRLDRSAALLVGAGLLARAIAEERSAALLAAHEAATIEEAADVVRMFEPRPGTEC